MTQPVSPSEEYFRLRAEWLRFKNHVFDANTELPTLAAVLDDVRRLMEERGTLGLVYIDLGGDGHVGARARLAGLRRAAARLRAHAGLAARGRAARLARHRRRLERAQRQVPALPPRPESAPSVDPLRPGGPRPAAAGARSWRRCPRTCRRGSSCPVTFHEGYAVMYRDPMLRAERSIHRALDEAMFMAFRQRTRDEDRRAHGLDEIMAGGQLHHAYQPIVDLQHAGGARPRGLHPRTGRRAFRGGGTALRAGRAHRPPAGAGAAVAGAGPGLGQGPPGAREPSCS